MPPPPFCAETRLYGLVMASSPPACYFAVEGFEALCGASQGLVQAERVRAFKLLLGFVGVTVVWRLSRIGGDPGSR